MEDVGDNEDFVSVKTRYMMVKSELKRLKKFDTLYRERKHLLKNRSITPAFVGVVTNKLKFPS